MIEWKRKFMGGLLAVALVVAGTATPALAGPPDDDRKVDRLLSERAGKAGKSKVIVTFEAGSDASDEVGKLGGTLGRRLESINGRAIELPNAAISRLADHPAVRRLHFDRPTGGELNRAAMTVGARAVQSQLGLSGTGVGVAVIDSGITGWHDDLRKTKTDQRLVAFVDFVNGGTTPYDDNGHGTHVAGIIAGNGALSSKGEHAGIAPGSHLVALKVLDGNGRGVISNVIAAIDWVLQKRSTHNIRVVNLSVGAAVTESFKTDPLTLAAKRLVDAGVVVVTAAGNLGRNANGETQYGAITAPGNAPWVLTVGAYSHENTVSRSDDVMAGYSSRGPTAIDYAAKPDLVAPGSATVSLSDPSSQLYYSRSGSLVDGVTSFTAYKPYLRLTGTSMAAPIVSGTVALMLQANPSLTPNLVKAILQYTAEGYSGYDFLTQGAGFVNSFGAVSLARFYATAKAGDQLTVPSSWSKQIIWGNRRISRGIMVPTRTAFTLGTTWGASYDVKGQNIVWGTGCSDSGCDNIVWGTNENIVWGTSDNIVWGTNIVWGSTCNNSDCDNIVWGTHDNIVWGTNVVWGTTGKVDSSTWGAAAQHDNITWGTATEQEGK